MAPYFILFLVPALFALHETDRNLLRSKQVHALQGAIPWLLAWFVLTAIIGLRREVGADWANYLRYIDASKYMGYSDVAMGDDPAYWLLNVASSHIGFGVTGVNLVGGAIFSCGLVVFCRTLPRPWLGFACAVPYLVVVVSMGYTRQGIAIGLAMLGFAALSRGKPLKFAIWMLAAATFHKSAIVILPIAGILFSTKHYVSIGLILLASVFGYLTLLSETIGRWAETYVDETMISSGAAIRLGMNAVPAAIFLYIRKRKRFMMPRAALRFYSVFSLLSLALFMIFFITDKSTALDRIALYLIPLQVILFSYLPGTLYSDRRSQKLLTFFVLLYYLVVLVVWLLFATHSSYWVPYRAGWTY